MAPPPASRAASAAQETTACKTEQNKKEWTTLSIGHNETAAELCMVAAAVTPIALLPGAQAGGVIFAAMFAAACAAEWKLSAMYARWANDPPDPNFTTVAAPDIVNMPKIKPSRGISKKAARALTALLRNLAEQGSYTEALTHAFERSQGAAQAGDKTAEDAQRRAASRYAAVLADLVQARARLAGRAGAAVRASRLGKVTIGPKAARKVKKRLRRQGFPPRMNRMLDRAEVPRRDRAALKRTLRRRSVRALSGTPIAALLTGRGLAADDKAAGLAFERLKDLVAP